MASSFTVPKASLLSGSQFQPQQKQHHPSKISFQSPFNPPGGAGSSSASTHFLSTRSQSSDDFRGKMIQEEKPTPDASAIAAFMTQVSDLVKLVDSRDITELQLKQLDCELIIRKKEALPQPPAAAPVYMMQPPNQHAFPSQPPPPPPAPASAPASASPAVSAPALPAPKSSKSSHPTVKCPMAGTFYRCPGPGEPPFVKVGDKIKKGQVVCIVEAMKLMNEIESDQSGTVVEVLMEDGKPVSVDTPLFVVEQ